jgi:hypothetical protein
VISASESLDGSEFMFRCEMSVSHGHLNRLVPHQLREVGDELNIRNNVDLVVATSPAVSSNVATSELSFTSGKSIDELRLQIIELGERVTKSKNEIIEVQKIDPILEATLRFAVENLTKRLEV